MREAAPTLEDILEATRVVARIARNDTEALALAWTIRSRARAAASRDGADARAWTAFGDGSLSAAARTLMSDAAAVAKERPAWRRLLRAASIVCRVLADAAPDPTGGAGQGPSSRPGPALRSLGVTTP